MSEISLEYTQDGSPTIYRADIDEHYHSVYGARTESEYIFIGQGLNQSKLSKLTILEIGLGTGLNLMLTMLNAGTKIISYDAIERYPVPKEMATQYVAPFPTLEQHLFNQIHEAQWNKRITITPSFDFQKISGDVNTIEFPQKYDIVYFDAFSPDKQPEMWSEILFRRIYDAMNEGGYLVTYCSKGLVKQNLRKVGFQVVRKQGPPHKHHMLVATKINT